MVWTGSQAGRAKIGEALALADYVANLLIVPGTSESYPGEIDHRTGSVDANFTDDTARSWFGTCCFAAFHAR